ncbi:MAG: branched-chain amino acid ABC transporter permease [Alphaproteobacteria bacterium]|nr:branched-chain amino acid ABC transporter permease [Alphaproteobacteria bacterium]
MIAAILSLSAIYVMLAVGFVIVYRTSHVLNFAHGDVFMVSGYLGFALITTISLPPYWALPVSLAGGAISGLLIYAVLMAPMAGHSIFAAVLVTIALGMAIRGLALVGFKGQVTYPGRILSIEDAPYTIVPGVTLTTIEILIVLSAIVVMVALTLFFRYSPWGIRMRAASQDPRLAAYRGINIHAVFAGAWVIASAVAMYAGTLYSFSKQLSPSLSDVALRGLAVALVGGMDSMKGVVPAAIAVAAIELLVQRYGSPQMAEAIPFLIVLLVLLIRPWGLFGTKEMIDRI